MSEELKGPDLSPPAVAHYLATRPSTLVPPPFHEKKHLLNPLPGLREITLRQWSFIGVAFFGWTWDAFDFFSVSIVVPNIAKSLDRTVAQISWGITVVLMLRSVGAVIFGLAADKWGRKWPFIINCLVFIALELGTGFVQTYPQFLAVRALFGIAMGGMFGNCASTALDDCPPQAKGLISGLLQQGYAFGYLLVVIFNRAIADNSPHGWRALFWFGAGPPVLIIIWRLCLPENDAFLEHKRRREVEGDAAVTFVRAAKESMKTHWLLFIFQVLFMVGMNFMSHGSQDLYPTRLKKQLDFSENAATVTNCVANLGALTGGILFGHLSQFVGRRLTIMICCVIGAALIYPWGFSHQNASINATAFFMQMMVQGAWGVVPIHLMELSPPALRAFASGTSYQLGNLASSAASTIEATIGTQFPLYDKDGNKIPGMYDYGKVMAILMGAVFAYTFVVCFLGPERRNADGDIREIHDEENVDPEKITVEYIDKEEIKKSKHSTPVL
ncbi:Carboxylic acid transporter [Wickerhamiella sorbophila]|uniref:Carboxylic acid transporter n=1 Tax=Wickerhamiella sorbophila TaxID=45607 RepID=A0A2T0FI37_9ASCO|nr:Carboxylic acid transporter [Wickerhamiella sorbophila]PRT54663.1 Carboxylic acid transporter [Wickerhamiella sorbophila]